jgi:hypothetical protein
MADEQVWTKPKLVAAIAVLVIFILLGWVIFPQVMVQLGVPSTFRCHCIGDGIGLLVGILVIRKVVL